MKELKKNTKYSVYTSDGFKKFSGISKQLVCNMTEIITPLSSITATQNHKFKTLHGDWLSVSHLKSGVELENVGVITELKNSNERTAYDLIEVEDTHSYIANNFNSHNCAFIGSSQTLIEADTLLGLQARPPIKIWRDISYYIEPIEGHTYIMTVDVSRGRGQDYSTFVVFDVTRENFETVCVYRNNMISPLMFPEYIVRTAKAYNNATVIIENNDSGQVVCNSVYYEYEYDNTFVSSSVRNNGIGVLMTKRVKRIGCSNLKDLVESNRLLIYDANIISELTSFEPRGDSYAASGDNHDDLVMNLVLFSWFVNTDAFASLSQHNLKELLYSERIKEIEEDVVPFGIISDASEHIDSPMRHYERQIEELNEWNSL